MSDSAAESNDWPSPTNSKVMWKGGPESRFESDSKLGGEPQDILYRLCHPQTDDTPCWHQGKDLPYFFEYCPYCRVELRASTSRGVWLPPFGWAPFNGVSKSGRYHPRSLKNRPSGWSIPGNGPLRFWILPLASSENGGDSYVFAYRPSTGQIYWLPDLQKDREFSACTLEGERDAIRSLRGEPLGSARSWSVVWSNDHLFIGTKSGLLLLDMVAEGKIQVKKVFDGACLSSPAMAGDGQVYFLADRADGAVSIATLHLDDMDSIQWCDWWENVPALEDLSEISAPVGVEGGDVHWVCRRGVIVLEGDQGRWISAKPGVHLETRVQPWFSGTEMRVYGREKNKEFVYYALSALTSGATDGDSYKSALPYHSGSDTQWFVNGQSARHQHPDFDGNMEKMDLWPVGSWEAEIEGGKGVAHILMARFTSDVPLLRMFGRAEGYDKDVTVTELTVSNNQTSAIHPHGNELVKLRMPLDTLIIPVGAESILIYKGDTDPGISVLDLSRSSF